MLAKLPIISSPVKVSELAEAFAHINNESVLEEFSFDFSRLVKSRHIYFTNSGLSSFYIILNALKQKSEKKEVILPAYTAGSLIVAVVKVGLVPVLCDISLEDFNLDKQALFKAISQNTLAIVCIHMFGIPTDNLEQLKEKIPPDIFLIEDCAQAMGSKIREKQVGSFTDVGFFSFNRGKNVSTYGGGCVTTNSVELAKKLDTIYSQLVKESTIGENLSAFFKILALSLAINPFIYGLGYPFISCFKDVTPPHDFPIRKITNLQARLCFLLLRRLDELSTKRYFNGMFLINALKAAEGIILPKISEDTYPAFNRLPLAFQDPDKRRKIEKKLWRVGIETSRMYLKPLHHMFDLGYRKENFPNANYLAEHLLTLPVHPLVKREHLSAMINIIRELI